MNNSYCKEIIKVKRMTHGYIEGDLVRIKTEPNNITPNEVVYKFVVYVAIDNVFLKLLMAFIDLWEKIGLCRLILLQRF